MLSVNKGLIIWEENLTYNRVVYMKNSHIQMYSNNIYTNVFIKSGLEQEKNYCKASIQSQSYVQNIRSVKY